MPGAIRFALLIAAALGFSVTTAGAQTTHFYSADGRHVGSATTIGGSTMVLIGLAIDQARAQHDHSDAMTTPVARQVGPQCAWRSLINNGDPLMMHPLDGAHLIVG